MHGTTGYRFANEVNGVLVDPSAQPRFDRLWRRYGAGERDFQAHALRGKREVIQRALPRRLEALTEALAAIAAIDRPRAISRGPPARRAREHRRAAAGLSHLRGRHALRPGRELIERTVADAARQRPRLDPERAGVHARRAARARRAGADDAQRARRRALAQRFQQFTAPVAAKGVEDTAFYRYHRFVPLDEVGGEPGRFGLARTAFHAANAERAHAWPHGLLATSTHDNKRSRTSAAGSTS